jgi:hypothetical protein
MQRGIVHQNVNLSETLQDLGDHTLHVMGYRNVSLDDIALTPQGLYRLADFCGRLRLADVVNGDTRPGSR